MNDVDSSYMSQANLELHYMQSIFSPEHFANSAFNEITKLSQLWTLILLDTVHYYEKIWCFEVLDKEITKSWLVLKSNQLPQPAAQNI